MKFTLLLVILLAAPVSIFAQGTAKFLRDRRTAIELTELQNERAELARKLELARKQGNPEAVAELRAVNATLDEREKDLRAELKKVVPPKDVRTSVRNLCPVHKLAMPTRQVPIAYGLLMGSDKEPSSEVRAREFPHARTWHWGGCVVFKDFPDDALVYVCPECVHDEKLWLRSRKAK